MPTPFNVVSRDHLTALCITSGDCLACIGAQNGLFPELDAPVPGGGAGLFLSGSKLADGFYLAVDDVPMTQACVYQARPFENEFLYRLPEHGLLVRRAQYVPDGRMGMVVTVTLTNLTAAPRYAEVSFTVRSCLVNDEETAKAGDICEYDERVAAFFARNRIRQFHLCYGAQTDCPALLFDTPEDVYGFGNTSSRGSNGRLFYRVHLPAEGDGTLTLYIAGSSVSRSQAESELETLRGEGDKLYDSKRARYERLLDGAVFHLPDPTLQQALCWAIFSYDWLLRRCAGHRLLLSGLPIHTEPTIEGSLPALGGLICCRQGRAAWNTLRALAETAAAADASSIEQYLCAVELCWLFTDERDLAQEALSPLAPACRRLAKADSPLYRHYQRLMNLLSNLPDELDTSLLRQGLTMDAEALLGELENRTDSLYRCMPIRPDTQGDVLTAISLHQIVYPILTVVCGVWPNAPMKTLRFDPQMPLTWNEWDITGLAIGQTTISIKARRNSMSSVHYEINSSQSGWTVILPSGEKESLDTPANITLHQ